MTALFLYFAWQQLNAMNKTIEAMERQMIAAERPAVVGNFYSTNQNHETNTLEISYKVGNHGNNAAVDCSIDVSFSGDGLRVGTTKHASTSGVIIGANQVVEGDRHLSGGPTTFRMITDGSVELFGEIHATYKDVLGNPYEYHQRYKYIPEINSWVMANSGDELVDFPPPERPLVDGLLPTPCASTPGP